MIKIDGKNYNINWVMDSLQQTAEILNGNDSGRLQGTYNMYLQYGATFLNHKGDIVKSAGCTEGEWNLVFRVLMNPKNKHTITFPFDDGEIQFDVYISSIARGLKLIKQTNKWDNVYSVSFISMNPCWRVDENFQGYVPYDNR